MKEKLIGAFQNLLNSAVTAVPKIFVGLLLVVLAFIVAKLIEKGLRYALIKVRFEQLISNLGIDQALHRLGIRQELTALIPRLTYFLVLLLLVKTVADATGLAAISDAIGAFFAYLPNIVAALLLLILGSTAGQFAGQTVAQSAESSGIEFAPTLGKLVSALILFVCAMMAIAQLKIDTEIVRIVTSLILGGAALAFGLSFGLGTRDIVRNIAAGFYVRKILTVGKPLQIDQTEGILTAVTPTHIIIESDGHESAIANAAVLDRVARQ